MRQEPRPRLLPQFPQNNAGDLDRRPQGRRPNHPERRRCRGCRHGEVHQQLVGAARGPEDKGELQVVPERLRGRCRQHRDVQGIAERRQVRRR
ncbi:hypothetical protein LINGRAHAP2_LOCUS25563 [Linum grandiflorum]